MQGFLDLLPEEAEAMRAAQEALLAEMRSWGYRYVVTPSLESLDVLQRGLGDEQRRALFKFADGDGRLLALVGDRTVPVARLVAGKLRARPVPFRLCYAAQVVTNQPGRISRRRESHQVGAELIGARGPVADAEVIALAVRCLDAAGLSAYQLDVGHAEFFAGLLDGLKVSEPVRQAIRTALAERDLVSLEEILSATRLASAEHELLLRFPALRGGREILSAAGGLVTNGRSERALQELERILDLLALHQLTSVQVDLGAIRDFDYYTGVIFEAFAPDLGRPLAQGGRYDNLLQRFGRPAVATGFVVQMDLVGELLFRARGSASLPSLTAAVSWAEPGLESALRLGATLRLFGMRTVVDTQPRSLAASRQWVRTVGGANLVHVEAPDRALMVPNRGRARRLPPEQVAGRLVGALA